MRWCVGLTLFLGALTLGWGCRGVVVDHQPVEMTLPTAPDCREPIGPITLTALGDFPTTDADVALLDGSGADLDPITRFPSFTLAFSASTRATSGRWDAFGWASRAGIDAPITIVMRPLGLSCPIADSEARLPDGAALAVLDETRVMFVGGLDEAGQATRRVAILDVRDEHVDLPAVARVIPIAFAAATLLPAGDAVLVTGGASSRSGEGRDTWERIPLDGGMATFGALDQRRRDHGAIVIDAGAVHGVLLVGGTSDGHDALDSIEWVDPTTDTGGVLTAHLAVGRVAPLLVQLDGTHVGIVGGRDAVGAAVTTIEVLDVAHDSVSPRMFTPALATPDWIAPLPSGRIAWAAGGSLRVVSVDPAFADVVGTVPIVADAVAVALASGRVLLEGGLTTGTRQGFVIDPGVGTTTPVATSRVPRRSLLLPDGTVLELAATASSARRDERLTPFDTPPPMFLFAADRGTLALDAAPHWSVSSGALAPVAPDARLDIPVLRLRHFEAVLDATGAYDVLLTGEHLETLALVTVTDDTVSLGTCSVPRQGARHVRIARAVDGSLAIGTVEAGSAACGTSGIDPHARVGLGIVAHSGALRSLALTRDLF